MENYRISLNDGIENTDYSAFQIFDQKNDVVAIVRTSKIKLLELEELKEGLNMEELLYAIKDRFPGIDVKGYKNTTGSCHRCERTK